VPTRTVDLSRVHLQAEIVVRAGDSTAPHAKQRLQHAYTEQDATYPDAIGISVVFRPMATLDELLQAGQFPHKRVSYTHLSTLVHALGAIGYEVMLYVTPTPDLPDHHFLAVAYRGSVQQHLADDVADVLIHTLTVIDNPYRRP